MLTAQELRTKRQEHKMTQAQLAQAVGLEESLIANYEKGESPIPAEHEEKLLRVWRATAGPKTPTKAPAKKPSASKAPALTQWLQNVAQDKTERPAKPAAHQTEKSSEPSAITQATAHIANDKQRRAALGSLLNAALGEIDNLFVEDKQTRATAEAIEQLQPSYKQLILGMMDQFDQIKPSAQGKARLPAQEQVVQALKGVTPYDTVLNYLEAAVQILKQAEVADRTPLMLRLQSLSDFDRNTINMMTKRYQELRNAKQPEATPAGEKSHTANR